MDSSACTCRAPCTRARTNSVLFRHGEPVRFERGVNLWREGDLADAVYVVCAGLLRVERGGTQLELIPRGGVIGEEVALPGAARTTRCEVMSAGSGLRLTWDVIEREGRKETALYRALLEIALERSQRHGFLAGSAAERREVSSCRADASSRDSTEHPALYPQPGGGRWRGRR